MTHYDFIDTDQDEQDEKEEQIDNRGFLGRGWSALTELF